MCQKQEKRPKALNRTDGGRQKHEEFDPKPEWHLDSVHTQ